MQELKVIKNITNSFWEKILSNPKELGSPSQIIGYFNLLIQLEIGIKNKKRTAKDAIVIYEKLQKLKDYEEWTYWPDFMNNFETKLVSDLKNCRENLLNLLIDNLDN